MSSTPVSVFEGISTTNTLAMKRYVVVYLAMLWFSLLPSAFLAIRYLQPRLVTGNYFDPWFLLMFPFQVLFWWLIFVFMAIFVARVFLWVVNLFHKPREGIFERSKADKDYRYWSLRGTIKKFAFWATHTFPLPWLDIVAFKVFGVKAKGGTAFFDCWVDSEFIEIGDNTLLGLGAVVLSSMIVGDKLVIQRVKIGNHNLIGAHTVVAPGTVVGDNVVLGALSTTSVGQVLESNWIYTGVPARKFKENKYAKDHDYTGRVLGYEDEEEEIPVDHFAKADSKRRRGRRRHRKVAPPVDAGPRGGEGTASGDATAGDDTPVEDTAGEDTAGEGVPASSTGGEGGTGVETGDASTDRGPSE
ncbi:MAG: DapH/DapD/GlmU-related protein [Promethearchaeota archaeon]